jgi:hypothetical protein
MTDYIFIYLIVALNTTCQLMLIWRQKLEANERRKFCSMAIAIPIIIMVTMRLLIAGGAIHGSVAEQSLVEQYVTKSISILLIAGPWFVTIAAIIAKMKMRTVLKKQTALESN